MSLSKELEDRVLMVSITPTLPRTQLEAPGAHRRVDSFIQRLRFMSDLENKLVVFDSVPPSEPCECIKMREKYCNCKDKERCTCPCLKCDICKAYASMDVEKIVHELSALYGDLSTRLHAATTPFLTSQTLDDDFARDTQQPSAIYRGI